MSDIVMRNQAIVGELNAPRELEIRFDNPILDARFVTYEIVSKQLWDVKDHGQMVETAYNDDHTRGLQKPSMAIVNLHEKMLGPLFYSLYGVYGSGVHDEGLPMCIGDFKTLSDALIVLEGIGVINDKERTRIIAQALGEEMEMVR